MLETVGVKVLMYHWVSWNLGQRLRQWGVTPDQLDEQMTQLAEWGYESLTLGDVVSIVRGEMQAPRKGVTITFDDGYRDNLTQAWPILKRHGLTATFFLVADNVGGTNTWDAFHGDGARELMGWDEAAELAAQGAEIGSHSRSHRFLTDLSDRELEVEIRGSKEKIEDRLGRPVRFFSYPYGLYDSRCLQRVGSAGYEGACSDFRGANRRGTDPFLIRRSLLTCHDSSWSFAFKLRNGCSLREWLVSRAGPMGRRLAPAISGVIP